MTVQAGYAVTVSVKLHALVPSGRKEPKLCFPFTSLSLNKTFFHTLMTKLEYSVIDWINLTAARQVIDE